MGVCLKLFINFIHKFSRKFRAPTRLSAVTSPLSTLFVCPSQRRLCPFADSSVVEVFEKLAADWRQSLAASPFSEKCQNFPGFLAGTGADFVFFSKTISAKSGFMNVN